MTNAKFVGEMPHAVLFLFDAKYDSVEIPDYEEGHAVVSSNSALNIAVVPDFEGETSIELGVIDDAALQGLEFLGVFKVFCPTRQIDINSSEQEGLASYSLTSTTANLKVYVDEPDYASLVKIVVA